MNVIFYFRLNNKKFVFYLENNKIYLSNVEEEVLLKVSDNDKSALKRVIEILSNSDFNIKNLIENNIVIIDRKGLNFKNQNNENSVNIAFSDEKHNIFIDNCNSIYNEPTKNKKGDKAKLLLLILPIIAVLVIFTGLYFKQKNDKKEFLEKYTIVYSEKMADIENLEYEFIEIKSQEITDNPIKSFDIEFDSPFTGYESISKPTSSNQIPIEIFESKNAARMVVWPLNYFGDYSSLEEWLIWNNEDELYELGYTEIDFKSTFQRHNIKNTFDLKYHILKNIDVKVDIKSSKQEIIDKYVFDYLRPLEIPYNRENKNNKFYFFTGDKYGYAVVQDKQTVIEIYLEKETQFRVLFDGVINKEDIIKVVSTIKKQ